MGDFHCKRRVNWKELGFHDKFETKLVKLYICAKQGESPVARFIANRGADVAPSNSAIMDLALEKSALSSSPCCAKALDKLDEPATWVPARVLVSAVARRAINFVRINSERGTIGTSSGLGRGRFGTERS